MTLCPIALIAGCSKCPVVSICPLKGVIGDYKKQDEKQAEGQEGSPEEPPKSAGK